MFLRLLLLGVLTFSAVLVRAQSRAEYVAFWVDTFNTALQTPSDIQTVVDRARQARANALFVQVRRRGDAWYINSLEPQPDFLPIPAGFDPLHALIQEAHQHGIEVHAFVIMGAIWNKNPNFAPTATLGPPTSPQHVFNRQGGFDPSTGRIEPGPGNWLTRTLTPDGTAGISFQGHRFGSEFWLDFGHPDAASHSVEVVTHLVRNYDIDGLHLDRIRYPEFSATGQTPATGASVGYNAVSVWRFQQRYGMPHDEIPAAGDARWAQWRRDQVTNVVRRIYLESLAIRPRIVVSAALIVYGGFSSWAGAEAYWRVYQDWRAWLEEGIIDIAIPMNYKRDDVAQQATWFDQWNEFTCRNPYGRASMMGLGVYLNTIPSTMQQIRRSRAACDGSLLGVNLYAMANPDSAGAGYDAFAAALRDEYPAAPFLPRLPWKAAPVTGHMKGQLPGMDGAAVYVYNEQGQIERTATADGSGFFGAVDLRPGRYVLIVELGAQRFVSKDVFVEAGQVATATF